MRAGELHRNRVRVACWRPLIFLFRAHPPMIARLPNGAREPGVVRLAPFLRRQNLVAPPPETKKRLLLQVFSHAPERIRTSALRFRRPTANASRIALGSQISRPNSPETRLSSARTRSPPRGTRARLRPRLGRPRVVRGERPAGASQDARSPRKQESGRREALGSSRTASSVISRRVRLG